MLKTITTRRPTDFEALGYQTMFETGNEVAARDICSLHLEAFADELRPEVSSITSTMNVVKGRQHALWTHLYDRLDPVRDAAMLALRVAAGLLGVLILVAGIASVGGHTTTFYLFGSGPVMGFILGIALTGITTAAGYQAYEKLFVRHRTAEIVLILASFVLCFWGLFQMAQARGTMMDRLARSPETQSYVDDGSAQEPAEPARNEGSLEEKVRGLLGSAMVKIMIAADLILGILLAHLVRIWTNEDFVAWHDLKKSTQEVGGLETALTELEASVEIAKKRCLAGILRAKHMPRKRCVPYHQALPMMLLAVILAASPLFGQTINRHEGILIDVSGSIGKGGANTELFREYLFTVKRLLLTEPPESRVWVSVITTESFGSVRSLVKGWTPDAQGVFTDDLDRARRELAARFETKSAGMKPTAAGTDIIGGLWQLKALIESGSRGTSAGVSKTIWIASDMMNESATFNMPALLPAGPEEMLSRAKQNGLVVPLHGYQIHVIGASPAGLTPQAWNTLRAFWTMYFREAGGELISYSAECDVGRK